MSVLREQINRSFNPKETGIVEFAEEMCNKPLYPRQRVLLKLVFLEDMNGYEEDVLSEWISGGEVLISPKIRERRDWLRANGYAHFRETILVGGRRSSKGYVTGIAGAKKLYDTQQMGDPGLFYGIDPQKEIYFTCVAASLEQAKQFQFADLAATVGQCKPLAPHLSKLQEEGFSVHTAADERYVAELKSRRIKVNRDFAKLRAKPLAANADTIRGSTSMFICMDEMAFMLPGESRSTAEQCYNAAAPALAQFGRSGMIFLNSSPYTKVGKFFERFELAMGLNDTGMPLHPVMFALQFPSWELYRDYDKDPEHRFKNALMVSPDWPVEALSLDDQARQMEAQFEEEANPETFKVERRAQWAEVVDAYLRPEMVDRAFDLEPFEGMQVRPTSGGIFQFLYKGHCDPSSTTAGFGFAMAHVEEWNDPNYGGEKVKHVVFDLVKRWNPKDYPGQTIDYISVQEEIADYIQVYRPQEFSFDQFQCLSGSTRIATTEGYRTLRQIADAAGAVQAGATRQVSDVLVHTLEGEAPLQEIFCRGQSPTRLITARGGYAVEATPEHRLYVRRAKVNAWDALSEPEWVVAGDMEVGDWLCVMGDTMRDGELVDITQYRLPLNHGSQSTYRGVGKMGERWYAYARTVDSSTKRLGWFDDEISAARCSEEWHRHHPGEGWKVSRYPEEFTPELAALCGWVIGEGSISSKTYDGSVSNAEPEAIEEICSSLATQFGGEWRGTCVPDKNVWAVSFSRPVGQFLTDLGCGGVSRDKDIPEIIWHSPRSVVIPFLRALFDGEGSIQNVRANDERLTFHSTSPKLARGVRDLLVGLGMFPTFWAGQGRDESGDPFDTYRVKLYGADIVRFAELIGFVSLRKATVLAACVAQINGRPNVGLRRRNLMDFDDKALWVKVVTIEDSSNVCYDISVPGPESFIADGLVSHNSQGPIQWLRQEMMRRRVTCMIKEKTATKDVNWKRWETFKTALNLGLVHIPPDCPDAAYACQELKFLQVKNGKVDRQEIGPVTTKDIGDCALPDSQVLTCNGWKLIGDVEEGEAVATRAPDGRLVYQIPTQKIARYYSGPIHLHDGKRLNFGVTPNHRMLVSDRDDDCFFELAKDIQTVRYVPKTVSKPDMSSPTTMFQLPSLELPEPIARPEQIPGWCFCGCGSKTPKATRTRSKRGDVKGQPRRFVPGHHAVRWSSADDEYLRESYGLITMPVMLERLGKTRHAVYCRAKNLGLWRGQIGDRINDRPALLPECRLEDFAAFVGIWLAEGKKIKYNSDGVASTGYEVKLTQTKVNGIAWIDALMQRLGWPYRRWIQSNGETAWAVYSYELREYLRALQDGHELRLPDEALFEWDARAQQSLLDGLLVGDGTFSTRDNRFIRYDSTSYQLVGDVQRLLVHLGMIGTVRKVREKGSPGQYTANYDGWKVTIDLSERARLDPADIEIIPYDGMVYCLTVPNGTLLMRRKGVPMWCGNCIAECVEWLIGNVIESWKGSLTQGLQLGAQGGFQIGGRDRLGPASFSDHYGNRHQVGQNPSRGINPMRRGPRS